MYRFCIFDLDGTLVNSIHALTKTTNLTLEAFGLPPVTEEQMMIFVGDGYKMQMKRALLASGDKELLHHEASLEVYTRLFKEHCLYRLEAYDGIKELLAFLKEQGIKIAVVSNKPHARTVENVEFVFGKGYFDFILGEQEGIRKKPAPDGVNLALRELGAKPEECLYFGDTNTDMETGKAAGIDRVGVTWGFRGREELQAYAPEYLVDAPGEVIEIIEKSK